MSFKVRLLLSAAAPLVMAMPAAAQVSISTATTAPIATATASSGSPANVDITSSGSITLADTNGATAVTVNSNNTVSNAGSVNINNANNSTGVLIEAGRTTSYSGAGAINILEDYTRPNTDNDNDLDGPVASATSTGRTGLLLQQGAAMTGNITISSGGRVSVEGNNSAGVSLRSGLNGSFVHDGATSLVGANGFGVDIREDVTGNVALGGTINANGEGSAAVRVLGDVGGEFLIDGGISASGFTDTQRTNYADPDLLQPGDTPVAQRLDADDLLIGGAGLSVSGNLARGLLVNGAAAGGVDPTPNTKDVVQNFNENRTAGSVTSLGSAPAMVIRPLDGSAGANISLGLVRETIADTLDDDDDDNTTETIAVFDYEYGFMNRGTIQANGVNVGIGSDITATGLRIAGSADGAYTTTIQGGVFNGGTLSARAFEAEATALDIGAGAVTPRLVNEGSIVSQVNTEDADDAVGVRIAAGASVGAVVNAGSIAASVRGYDGDAIAFQDLSGSVASFTNSSRISAGYVDDDTTDAVTSGLGRAVALDLSRRAGGVTLVQSDSIGNARIFGDVRLGAGDDRFDLLSGEAAGDVSFGGGSDTFNIRNARLTGDASFLGSGAAVSLANNAQMTGDLSFGTAAGTLSIASGSTYTGAVTRGGGGSLSLAVNGATFNNSAHASLALTSMSAQNGANIGVVVSNARINAAAPIFDVAGAATIGADTTFTPIFSELRRTPFSLRVVRAGALNLGGPIANMLADNAPFLYDVSLSAPAGQNAIDLNFRIKTADELDLNARSAGAYDAVIDLLVADNDVGSAIGSLVSADAFQRGWADLLPGQDAATIQVLAANSGAAFGAAAHRLDLVTRKPDAPGGAWVEEFGVYRDVKETSDALAVTGGGFGVAAGLDLFGGGNTVFGTFLSLDSVELEEEDRQSAPVRVANTAVGAYGGWRSGALAINGAASYGFSTFSSTRRIALTGIEDELTAEWDGSTISAAARASYDVPFGFATLTPYAGVDYTLVSQDGYTETSRAGDGLALTAGDAEHTLATAGYGAELSADFGFGDTFSLRPRISAGYRSILTWDASAAELRYAGGGGAFTLPSGLDPEDAIVGGLGVDITSQFLNVKLGYDAEVSDNATTHYGSVTFRLAFW